jgi:hypothetical protein
MLGLVQGVDLDRVVLRRCLVLVEGWGCLLLGLVSFYFFSFFFFLFSFFVFLPFFLLPE